MKIFVTGASRGIGAAIVEELANKDTELFITARSSNLLEKIADTARSKGSKVQWFACDLLNDHSIQGLIDTVKSSFGIPEYIILNAGVAKVKPVLATTKDEFDLQMNLNLRANFLIVSGLVPYMKPGSGLILIGSIASQRVFPNWGVYCASKHALRALAIALRMELKPRGIRVTVINPGAVRTELWDGVQDPKFDLMLNPKDVARWVKRVIYEPPHSDVDEITITPLSR